MEEQTNLSVNMPINLKSTNTNIKSKTKNILSLYNKLAFLQLRNKLLGFKFKKNVLRNVIYMRNIYAKHSMRSVNPLYSDKNFKKYSFVANKNLKLNLILFKN